MKRLSIAGGIAVAVAAVTYLVFWRPQHVSDVEVRLLLSRVLPASAILPPAISSVSLKTQCGTVNLVRYGEPRSAVRASVIAFDGTAWAIGSSWQSVGVAVRNHDRTIDVRSLGDASGEGSCLVTTEEDSSSGLPADPLLASIKSATSRDLTIARQLRLALGIGPRLTSELKGESCVVAITLAEAAQHIYMRELSIDLDWLPPVALPTNVPELKDPIVASKRLKGYLDTALGAGSYDVGHLVEFTPSGTGTGHGTLDSVCRESKAEGYTTVPDGKPLKVVELFAHEIAHQFGARHTHSSEEGRSKFSMWEPGEGTTIMAYGSQRDPYFHFASLSHVGGFLSTMANCGQAIPTAATQAVLMTTYQPRTVPESTPFEVTVDATGTSCVRISELDQRDQFDTALPIFRASPACATTRSFPSLAASVQGTGEVGDVLANGAHTMRFAAVAYTPEGRLLTTTMPVEMSDLTAFRITSLTCPNGCQPGKSLHVSWNPGKTTQAPFSVEWLNVELMVDGDAEWSKATEPVRNELAKTDVPIPVDSKAGTKMFVRLKAANNPFYSARTFVVQ